MAENDIIVPKENAAGGFDERVLTAADISAAAATHASTHHTGGSDALTPANIGAAPAVTEIEVPNSGTSTTTLTTGQLPARVIIFVDANDAPTATINLPTPGVRQSGLFASIKVEIESGSATSALVTVVHDDTTLLNGYELDADQNSIDFLWDGYAWTYSGTFLLRSYPNRVLQLPSASGTIALTADFASPPAIGNTTPNTGAFTTLSATGTTELVNGGTAAGPFRLYNQFTSATNFERLNLSWASNVAIIGTEKGSAGGSARALEFQTDGVSRWTIATNGTLSASSASRLNLNSLMLQHYGTGNALIGENCEYAGSWRYINSGAAGMFYFYGREGQFRFFANGAALAGLPNGGNSTQFKVNADGTVALGGTGSHIQGVYSDNTLAVNSTTATFKDAANIAVGTTTGTKIGTATTQKLGFFGATPVVQQAAVADATDAATTQARLNDLLAAVRSLGLIAT